MHDDGGDDRTDWTEEHIGLRDRLDQFTEWRKEALRTGTNYIGKHYNEAVNQAAMWGRTQRLAVFAATMVIASVPPLVVYLAVGTDAPEDNIAYDIARWNVVMGVLLLLFSAWARRRKHVPKRARKDD